MARFSVNSLVICAVLFLAYYSQAELPTVRLPKELGSAMLNKMGVCATEVNGEVPELMKQIYSWNITDEDKIKSFLACFYREGDNGNKFDAVEMVKKMDDFEKKDEVIQVLKDCEANASGSTFADKVFSYEECFIKNSPVAFRL